MLKSSRFIFIVVYKDEKPKTNRGKKEKKILLWVVVFFKIKTINGKIRKE